MYMFMYETDVFKEVWPDHFDDREIDDIIWSEIKDSQSKGDFICYQIHRPQKWRHEQEAQERLKRLGEGSPNAPSGYDRAVKRILALAEAGNASAMFHMGKLHVHGIGVEQDMFAAQTWYYRAIAAGELRAFCNLGWIYLYGFQAIPVNKLKAFELLSIGADNGIAAAKASVGLMLVTGEGIQANPARGLELLQEAFHEGYPNAGNHLSDMYFAGTYVSKDIEKAHEWLDMVVEAGDERTMAILGHYLVTGSHGKTDVQKGMALLERSIEKNFVPAYLWIGKLYKEGMGVPMDLGKAREWLERGVAAGNMSCTLALTMMLAQGRPSAGQGSSAPN